MTSTPQGARLVASTPVNTPFIWLVVVVLPLLSLVTVLVWDLDTSMRLAMDDTSDPMAQYRDPGYLLSQVSSVVFYGLSVLFAFFDCRTLRLRGMDRPFHWAWTFLSPIVYVIGRSVVVKRRSGRGLAPLWAYIGVMVLSTVVVVVKVVDLISTAMNEATNY